jgi:ATP-dependent DNA ligase
LDGKLVVQPVITVSAGKVNRSKLEQTELETRSIINKQKDKGYKLLDELMDTATVQQDVETYAMDYELIDGLLPKEKTDASDQRKPMLAKDVTGKPAAYYSKFNWWVSRKLDGVRALVRKKEKTFSSVSRQGKNYDPAFTNIFLKGELSKLVKKIAKATDITEDEVVLDGELYTHGMTLQQISGAARLDKYTPERHDVLQFWVFDYAHPTQTAEERCLLLNELAETMSNDYVRICSHVKLQSYETIKKIHDVWVLEGFEGAICRDATRTYNFGGRDDRMIKIKEFKDDEFEIVGWKEGLRDEDMCFTCQTEDGKQFDAKPMGDKKQKLQYIEDMPDLIGKFLTVKYFNYTPDGIPYLPVGKAIRDYE